jgi:hypothetical protein
VLQVGKISPLRIKFFRIKCADTIPIPDPIRLHSNSTALSSRVVNVDPPPIPDLLALVGDAADAYPGIPGIRARTAAQLLNRYGPIEKFPSNILGEQRKLALLFKNLATLRTDAPLFKKVETMRRRGPTPEFAAWADRMKVPRLLERCARVKLRHAGLQGCGPMTIRFGEPPKPTGWQPVLPGEVSSSRPQRLSTELWSLSPSGNRFREQFQALLSQRKIMFQLALHAHPQILRWTYSSEVP